MRTRQHFPPNGTPRSRLGAPALLAALLLAVGCSSDPASPEPTPDPDPDPTPVSVSDFDVQDVNSTSPRSGDIVSPRNYEGEVSAWYFGHAT